MWLAADYGETFSSVVKLTHVRTVLTIGVSHGWPIYQFDVTNVFLHGPLFELVFCEQPLASLIMSTRIMFAES